MRLAALASWRLFAVLLRALCVTSLALGLLACSTPAPDPDRSLLTGEPCAPPCWQNIVPGVSTKADVLQVLDGFPLVRADTMSVTGTAEGGVVVEIVGWRSTLWRRSNYSRNRVWIHNELGNNTVFRIEVELDYEVTFEEIIAQYGFPQGVHAAYRSHHPYYRVLLDYPAKGLSIIGDIPAEPEGLDLERGVGPLSATMKATRANYYAPTTLEAAFRDVFHYRSEAIETLLNAEQGWRGFGEIELGEFR